MSFSPLFPRSRLHFAFLLSKARSFSSNSSGLSSSVDLRFVRDNVDLVHRNIALRKSAGNAHAVVTLYESYGALQRKVDALRHQKKVVAASASSLKGVVGKKDKTTSPTSNSSPSFIEEGRRVKAEIAEAEAELAMCKIQLEAKAKELPCLSHIDAPIGPEANAREIMRHGPMRKSEGFKLRDHVELCKILGIAEFDSTTSSISGSGFVTLLDDGVELELAIVQWALSRLRNEGFTIALPPDLALSSLVEACGFNPRPADINSRSNTASAAVAAVGEGGAHLAPSQIYSVEGTGLCLIGTGEIPLAGMHAGQLLSSHHPRPLHHGKAAKRFPLLYAAFSHCFRHEAGGGGAASRGLYRLHQFSKVEMFAFTAPHTLPGGVEDVNEAQSILDMVQASELKDALCRLPQPSSSSLSPTTSSPLPPNSSHKSSDAMLCRLVDIQVKLMKELGLSFRVLDMPTEELGSAAHRKVDVEAWMPGRAGGSFGEVSSASNCIDYQARRLNCRFRPLDGSSSEAAPSSSTRFVHTLNATGAAVPRLILSILETYQREDGSVEVPKALQPYMGGKTEIRVK